MKTNPRIAILLGMALLLVACQATPPAATSGDSAQASAAPESEPASTAGSGEPVTLTFLAGFTGGDRAAYEGLIEEFNTSHPNIQVEMEIQPWDVIGQELPAAMATGGGPDIATPSFAEGSIFAYAESGSILPLDDAYGSDEGQVERDAIPEAALSAFTYQDQLYAVPANFATLLLYHNLDLLEEAGLDGPPETMDELRDYAVQLTETDEAGNVTQHGLALADNATIPMWPILIWAEGGSIVNDEGCSGLDSPETIQAVQSWADLVINENISPVGLTGAEADNLFAAGQAAMEMNGPWATGVYTPAGINYDVAPIPVGDGGPVTLATTVPMVLNANTEHPEAAYEFFAWWTSQEAQAALSLGSGFPPARTDMADNAELAEHEWVPKFAAGAADARVYLAGVEEFTQADAEVFIPAIQRITRGEPAEEVLTESSEELNALLGC
jgi:multiple sugar transport system substrate-binding protein